MKISLLKTILLICFLTGTFSSCPRIKIATLPGDVCFESYNSDNISVDGCPKDFYCPASPLPNINNIHLPAGAPLETAFIPFEENITVSCRALNLNESVDGEDCNTSQECSSKVCQSGICKGFSSGAACSSTRECATGLACSAKSSQCVPQLQVDSVCSNDLECENKAVCHDGKCIEYWSLAIGAPVKSSNPENVCETGFALNGFCIDYENQDSVPYNCTGNCTYYIPSMGTSLKFDGLCNCGANETARSYCQQGSTSNSWNNYKIFIEKLMNLECQSAKRFSCRDKVTDIDIRAQKLIYYEWKGYFQLSSNKEQFVLTGTSFVGGLLMVILISLFII